MKIKREEKGQKWGSNAREDPYNFRGEGAERAQLQTRVGPTKVHHFKTHNAENRGWFGPRSPSGSAHEVLFPMRSG